MRRRIIEHLLTRKPFKALRITLSTNERFDVTHPETAYLAKRFMAIAIAPGSPSGSGMVWIDYRHIVYCQPIVANEIPF